MYTLYIGNKNYSSWSLRPWILMKELGIAFQEKLVPFGNLPGHPSFESFSPTAKVPIIHNGDERVWESLAIVEYLAERHPGVWPENQQARTWARCAASEMHAGFAALRNACSMSVGHRIKLEKVSPALRKDIDRLGKLWGEGLDRFGGPFLAGAKFTAVDAMFCPVAFRVQTYGIEMPAPAMSYVKRLLALKGMREWYEAGLAENFRDPTHEDEFVTLGTITQDLRAPVA